MASGHGTVSVLMAPPWLLEIKGCKTGTDLYRLYVYAAASGHSEGRCEVPSDWAYRLLVEAEGELTDALFAQLAEPMKGKGHE